MIYVLKQHVRIVKNMTCLELLDGLYFCDECLNDIIEIKCLGEIEESIPVIKIKK